MESFFKLKEAVASCEIHVFVLCCIEQLSEMELQRVSCLPLSMTITTPHRFIGNIVGETVNVADSILILAFVQICTDIKRSSSVECSRIQ